MAKTPPQQAVLVAPVTSTDSSSIEKGIAQWQKKLLYILSVFALLCIGIAGIAHAVKESPQKTPSVRTIQTEEAQTTTSSVETLQPKTPPVKQNPFVGAWNLLEKASPTWQLITTVLIILGLIALLCFEATRGAIKFLAVIAAIGFACFFMKDCKGPSVDITNVSKGFAPRTHIEEVIPVNGSIMVNDTEVTDPINIPTGWRINCTWAGSRNAAIIPNDEDPIPLEKGLNDFKDELYKISFIAEKGSKPFKIDYTWSKN